MSKMAKCMVPISEDVHYQLKNRASELRTTISGLADRFIREGLGVRKVVEQEPEGYGYAGNAFTGIDVVDPDEDQHEI